MKRLVPLMVQCIPFEGCFGAHAACIRARVGLGEREATLNFCPHEGGEVLLALGIIESGHGEVGAFDVGQYAAAVGEEEAAASDGPVGGGDGSGVEAESAEFGGHVRGVIAEFGALAAQCAAFAELCGRVDGAGGGELSVVSIFDGPDYALDEGGECVDEVDVDFSVGGGCHNFAPTMVNLRTSKTNASGSRMNAGVRGRRMRRKR